MELIITILMTLGLLTQQGRNFDLNKIKTSRGYQKVYNKVGEHIDTNTAQWAQVVLGSSAPQN